MAGTRFTVVPALSRAEGHALARAEGQRLVELLSALSPEQWQAATECAPWTVRDMACHVLGNHEGMASLREQLHQLVAARRRGGDIVDAVSATQLADRAGLSGPEIIARLRTAIDGSLRARDGWLRLVRPFRTTIPLGGQDERWSLAYLHDVIYTRDAWMHRIDICRAAGVEPVLSAEHDGVMVARIVQEWADRHGQPYELELTGPAGGRFSRGAGGEHISIDAVEFCRAGSGRGNPSGLLAVSVGY
jgi:uncharacterized protein (TIGR03083 family)